ncbi:ribonuclease inhibitor-like [Pseudorasbora parva]|uniref:ribonuclease inhibitor-like n=1 Tax=Pseudorasbora parva TaxID=51549 RepID=UPI00351F21DE
MLCLMLEMPYCKLETLKLVSCDITDNCCVTLGSALRSNPSHLRNLDLSGNKLGYLGIKLLSDELGSSYSKLETLKLNDCDLTDEDCVSLASALILKPSNLREMDLSENKLGDSGVKLLSAGPESHLSKLTTFKLVNCGITCDGCAALASALRTQLRELDLTGNKVEDSGVNMLADELQNHYCQLEKLMLVSCGFTDEGCAALASALRSNSSKLREMDLSKNKLSDLGMKLLSAGLENAHCKLEVLRLNDCEVSDEGCFALASALTSNSSHLRELDLSDNKLGDFGVKMLCDGLEDPRCKLEILKLKHCGFTDAGCAALASVLGSGHSYLKYVDLSGNELGDLGVQLLSAAFY